MARHGRISVIIPAHDAAATIAESLASIASQTLAPDEIIIVDDGSTDRTGSVVEYLARSDSRIRVFRQCRAGPSTARNRAIAESTGDLIAPLDADDLWHPEYLQEMAAALRQAGPETGFAYCWHHLIDARGGVLRGPMPFAVEGEALSPLLLVNFVGNGSAAVFRREAVCGAGGYAAPLADWPGGEDYLLQLRIAAKWRVKCVARDLVAYRKSGRGLSANPAGEYRARIAAVEELLAGERAMPVPMLRWVKGDAARVRAVHLAKRHSWIEAAGWAMRALQADPAGTLVDFAARLRNAASRWRAGEMPPSLSQLDPLLCRRLVRLGAASRQLPNQKHHLA